MTGQPLSRFLPIVLLAALAATVFWLRTAPGWEFHAPTRDTVVLPETDPYYHFRQAAYTLEHYPRLMRWDADSHYPAVHRNDAAGLYSLLLATLAKIVSWTTGLAPLNALQWVAALLPPLGAAAMVPLVFEIVRRQAAATVAIAMALWFVLLPGDGLTRTVLGFCDHHVAEMILSLLCILGLSRSIREPARPWWRPDWRSALPPAVFLFTWVGAPIYLPIIALAFAAQIAADVLAGRPAQTTARAAARYWLAFLILVAATGALLPDLVMHTGLWRASCAGAAALVGVFACAGWFLDRPSARFSPEQRLLAATLGGAAALAALLALLPSLRSMIHDMVSRKSLHVLEHVPVTTRYYLTLTGLAGVLALLTPAAGILTGAARRPGWWLAVLPSLLLIALWCRTFDYAYLGALHAILLCGCLWGTRDELRATWLGSVTLAVATLGITAGVALGLTHPLQPPLSWYEGPVNLTTPGWQQATRWLALQPPADTPRAGVLTDWPHGNLVNTLGRHPAVASRYPEAEGLRPLFLESEADVRTAPLRGSTVADSVRYVVLSPSLLAEYLPTYLREVGLDPADFTANRVQRSIAGNRRSRPSMSARYERLFAHRLLMENAGGLSHFRLVFESDEQMFYRLVNEPGRGVFGPETTRLDTPKLVEQAENAMRHGQWNENGKEAYEGRILPSVTIYEQVPGARLAGRVQPGAVISAALRLRTGQGSRQKEFIHRIVVHADALGDFLLVVPYATRSTPSATISPLGPWDIQVNDLAYEWQVDELDVKNGGQVNFSSLAQSAR